jgi:hypothetical protein
MIAQGNALGQSKDTVPPSAAFGGGGGKKTLVGSFRLPGWRYADPGLIIKPFQGKEFTPQGLYTLAQGQRFATLGLGDETFSQSGYTLKGLAKTSYRVGA